MRILQVLIGICAIAGTFGQGFSYRQQSTEQFATRRQLLTPVQQSHILTDIQQHQHRFGLSPNQQQQQFPPQNQKNFVQKPNFGPQRQFFPPNQPNQFNPQPTQNTFRNVIPSGRPPVQNGPHAQHHTQTNFVANFQTNGQQNTNQLGPLPQNQPQFVHQGPIQQQFQRSVQNQLQQPQFQNNVRFQQISPNQQIQISPTIGQQLPTITTFQNQPIIQNFPQAQALIGQPPVPSISPSQAPFIGSQPISASLPVVNSQPQFFSGLSLSNPAPTQQVLSFPPVPSTISSFNQQPFVQSNYQPINGPSFNPQPQFQGSQQTYFSDPKQEEERIRLLKEKERIIQKHEQFVQKHQQKQQQKVQQLHQEFLENQQKIQQHAQKTVKQINPGQYVPRYTHSRGVLPDEVNLFQKAVQAYHEVHPTTSTTTTTTTPFPQTTVELLKTKPKSGKNEITISTPEQLEQLLQGQKLFGQLKGASKSKAKGKSAKGIGRDDLIKQLKLALAEQPHDLEGKNFTSQDIVLPDGQKVQVIRTSDPNLIPQGTNAITAPSSSVPVEQIVDPQGQPLGSDFELIKQTSDGKLEEVGQLPAQKKVTFVYLEEQNDGSYKIQGVKANGEKEAKTSGTEVDSILKRIKEGEIKLPPPTNVVQPKVPLLPTTLRDVISSTTPQTVSPSSSKYEEVFYSTSPRANSVRSTSSKASAQSILSNLSLKETNYLNAVSSTKQYRASTPVPNPYQSTYSSQKIVSTVAPPHAAALIDTTIKVESTTVPSFASAEPSKDDHELTTILKNMGLNAMAKYLKQSGLDTILNETGPYTIFSPTDKAFRSLLVQLGGPEKAEEKFKHNPRLLSGLLLHHVIPGSFEISSLQDEMTGVSLAGTQLRVNQYKLHDAQWNDIMVTTINGATVVGDKQDIVIPQGIAHGVDKVMFPLPVGDLLQTLQSDRERRFTNFLRAVFSANLSELLQSKGIKTYTVFAPTDEAFSKLPADELNALLSNKDMAEKLVMKHITPGTLFSAGMRFYQIKETMSSGKPITLQKSTGKIKVNDGNVVSSNIPATNGVIHAIDLLL